MVVPTQTQPFVRWLLFDTGNGRSALYYVSFTALTLLILAIIFAYLVSAFRHGPIQGARIVAQGLAAGLVDIVRISPRRVYGLATLAFREAFRRHIWVALVVLLILLAFTGWFLDPKSDDPAKLFLTWVVTPTNYLMLAIALYLSSLSLPTDIKNRTIYTVVTKPVRPSEVILGRIAGFTAACTVLLAIMGVAGYFFVIRAVSHRHEIVVEDEPRPAGSAPRDLVGYTTRGSGAGHRHGVRVPANSFSPGVELSGRAGNLTVARVTDAARKAGVNPGDLVTAIDGEPLADKDVVAAEKLLDGVAGSQVRLAISRNQTAREATLTRLTSVVKSEVSQGHQHEVIARWRDNKVQYEVGPAEGTFAARLPYYGELKFRDSHGDPKNPGSWRFKSKAISVGKIYGYRSYILGNSLAAAIWTFEGLDPSEFPDGLKLDLNIGVYRLEKGKVDEGITGSIWLRNPATDARSKERYFKAKEFTVDRILLPRRQEGPNGPIDIFPDPEHPERPSLTSPDGKIEVWLQCVEPSQSFGVARPDIYVRGPDASFAMNFFKAYVEIWLQVLLVTSLAVMFSTFLSGPVAILVTLTTIIMGFSVSFITNLTNSVIYRDELAVIEIVRQVAGQRRMDLELEGILRRAELRKRAGKPGSENINIERLQNAFSSPPPPPGPSPPDRPFEFQAEWELIHDIRQEVAQEHINLDSEGVARMAINKRYETATFPNFNEARLIEALQMKVDQVDVLDRVWGGGPCEAFYRLITQMNLMSDLDSGRERSRMTRIMLRVDNGLMRMLQSLLHVLPDFRRFNDTDYLASGYNIGGGRVAQHAAATLAFCFVAFVAGFFALKYREVAA